VNKHQEIVTN